MLTGKGGRTRKDGLNSAKSSGDMDGFRGGSFSESARASKQKRPGKSRRVAMKTKGKGGKGGKGAKQKR